MTGRSQKKIALNNVSEVFLQKASEDIAAAQFAAAAKLILMTVIEFDDDIDFNKYFSEQNRLISRDQFVELLKSIVRRTSKVTDKLHGRPEQAERLNRFGISLARCLADHGSSPEDMPQLRLPKGAVIYFKPFRTGGQETTPAASDQTAVTRKARLSG